MKINQYSKGFTIIEALTAVLFLGVLLAIAIPSYSEFVDRQRIKTDALTVAKTLSTARAQALSIESGSVTVRWNATVAPVNIDPADAAVGQIMPGEMVVLNSADNDILAQRSFAESNTIFVDNDSDDTLSFDSIGSLGGADAGVNIVGFLVCRRVGNNQDAIRVEIAATGRITQRLQTDAGGLGSNVITCP